MSIGGANMLNLLLMVMGGSALVFLGSGLGGALPVSSSLLFPLLVRSRRFFPVGVLHPASSDISSLFFWACSL